MNISITGVVKSKPDYMNIFGTIFCQDYNETYKFNLQDFKGNINKKLSVGDSVSFSLRYKYNSNQAFATDINLIRSESEVEIADQIDYNNLMDYFITEYDYEIKSEFKKRITKGFISFEYQNQDFKDLVKIIIQDDKITAIESQFINDKLSELNLDPSIINELEKYVESNNPYLDDIFALVFRDGIVSSIELSFIREKQFELGLGEGSVNERFWMFAINYHLDKLLNNKVFIKIIKLWHITNRLFSKSSKNISIIQKLNIFRNGTFEEIINEGFLLLKKELIEDLDAFFNQRKLDFDFLLDNIDINKYSFSDITVDKSLFESKELEVNYGYGKKEILTSFGLSHKSISNILNSSKYYHEIRGEYILFLEDSSNYVITNAGILTWESDKLASQSHKSVIEFTKSQPKIFKLENKKYKLIGVGKFIKMDGNFPVKIMWDLENNSSIETIYAISTELEDIEKDQNLEYDSKVDDYYELLLANLEFFNEFKSVYGDSVIMGYALFNKHVSEELAIKNKKLKQALWDRVILFF